MPFESYAQAAYLKRNEPEVYKRWVKKYGEPKDVPMKKRMANIMKKKRR
jgi:hypothetical protein